MFPCPIFPGYGAWSITWLFTTSGTYLFFFSFVIVQLKLGWILNFLSQMNLFLFILLAFVHLILP